MGVSILESLKFADWLPITGIMNTQLARQSIILGSGSIAESDGYELSQICADLNLWRSVKNPCNQSIGLDTIPLFISPI